LKVTEITQKIDAIKARLEGLEEEWLQLAEMLEE
jgi:hypothetical protein